MVARLLYVTSADVRRGGGLEGAKTYKMSLGTDPIVAALREVLLISSAVAMRKERLLLVFSVCCGNDV